MCENLVARTRVVSNRISERTRATRCSNDTDVPVSLKVAKRGLGCCFLEARDTGDGSILCILNRLQILDRLIYR